MMVNLVIHARKENSVGHIPNKIVKIKYHNYITNYMFGMSPQDTLNIFTTISTAIMLVGVGYAVYYLKTRKRNSDKTIKLNQEKCLGCEKSGIANTIDSKSNPVFVCKSCQKDAENNAQLDKPDP